MTIWKYITETTDKFSLDMPIGSKILSLSVQNGMPCIWVLVDPNAAIETRNFRVFGTGHPVDISSIVFIGTYQLSDGNLVFHLFEE